MRQFVKILIKKKEDTRHQKTKTASLTAISLVPVHSPQSVPFLRTLQKKSISVYVLLIQKSDRYYELQTPANNIKMIFDILQVGHSFDYMMRGETPPIF